MTLAGDLVAAVEYLVAALIGEGRVIADETSVTVVARAVVRTMMVELASREAELASTHSGGAGRDELIVRMLDYQEAAAELVTGDVAAG